jgi:hypothetical protein
MPTLTGNAAHDAAVTQAEVARQATLATILIAGNAATTIIYGGPSGPTPQNGAAMADREADVIFYRACVASAVANNLSPAPYLTALRELGHRR